MTQCGDALDVTCGGLVPRDGRTTPETPDSGPTESAVTFPASGAGELIPVSRVFVLCTEGIKTKMIRTGLQLSLDFYSFRVRAFLNFLNAYVLHHFWVDVTLSKKSDFIGKATLILSRAVLSRATPGGGKLDVINVPLAQLICLQETYVVTLPPEPLATLSSVHVCMHRLCSRHGGAGRFPDSYGCAACVCWWDVGAGPEVNPADTSLRHQCGH